MFFVHIQNSCTRNDDNRNLLIKKEFYQILLLNSLKVNDACPVLYGKLYCIEIMT